jgi:hypothetical protein
LLSRITVKQGCRESRRRPEREKRLSQPPKTKSEVITAISIPNLNPSELYHFYMLKLRILNYIIFKFY